MKRRFFHVSSDKKNIKELPFQEYQKIVRADYDNINKRLLCAVSQNWISIVRGRHVVGIYREQLEKILELTK